MRRKKRESSKLVELLIPRRELVKRLDSYNEQLEILKERGTKGAIYCVKGRILELQELLLKYGRNTNQPQTPKVTLYARLKLFKRRKEAVPLPKKG